MTIEFVSWRIASHCFFDDRPPMLWPHAMKTLLPVLLLLASALVFAQDTGKDEAQLWTLEKSYWEDVKANDLEK